MDITLVLQLVEHQRQQYRPKSPYQGEGTVDQAAAADQLTSGDQPEHYLDQVSQKTGHQKQPKHPVDRQALRLDLGGLGRRFRLWRRSIFGHLYHAPFTVDILP